jgi:ABC-2 type transport system ATP-binding protein
MAIELDRVSKRFRRKLAVQDVSLSLPRGCTCGLLGANGAGKTTTLKMLMGIERASAGSVRVLGMDPMRQTISLRQRIGYVPEVHYIYPRMRADRVLRFAARLYDRWNWDTCDRLTKRLDLPLRQQVKTLSRGQQVKLALTIALSHDPELLILDEPTSGLDPIVRRELLDLLAVLAGEGRCTLVFSTHILSDAERVADRIVIMHEGRVVANESLAALRSRFVKASLLFSEPPADGRIVPGALRVDRAMREWVALFPVMSESDVRRIAASIGATDCMLRPADLDDVYLQLAQANGNGRAGGAT